MVNFLSVLGVAAANIEGFAFPGLPGH